MLLLSVLSVGAMVVPPRAWVDTVVEADSDTIMRSLGGESGRTMVDTLKPFEGLWREPFVTRFSSDSRPIRTPQDGDAAGFLAQGESAVLRIEKLEPALRSEYAELLGDAWPRVEQGEWTAHLYASSPRMAALRNHSDVDDIVVFQLAGEKTWTYCMPDKVRSRPILGKLDKCETYNADEMAVIFEEAGAYNDCWVDTLRAGDALRVPRRTVHSARATAQPSLHLTVALVESRRRLTTTYQDPCEGSDDCFCDLVFPNTTETCGREEDVGIGPACLPGTFSQFGVYVAEFEGDCNSGCDSSCDQGCDNGNSNCDSGCDDSCDRACDRCFGCQVLSLITLLTVAQACPAGRFAVDSGSTTCEGCEDETTSLACSHECVEPDVDDVPDTNSSSGPESSSKKKKSSGDVSSSAIIAIVVVIGVVFCLCVVAGAYLMKTKQADSSSSGIIAAAVEMTDSDDLAYATKY